MPHSSGIGTDIAGSFPIFWRASPTDARILYSRCLTPSLINLLARPAELGWVLEGPVEPHVVVSQRERAHHGRCRMLRLMSTGIWSCEMGVWYFTVYSQQYECLRRHTWSRGWVMLYAPKAARATKQPWASTAMARSNTDCRRRRLVLRACMDSWSALSPGRRRASASSTTPSRLIPSPEGSCEYSYGLMMRISRRESRDKFCLWEKTRRD